MEYIGEISEELAKKLHRTMWKETKATPEEIDDYFENLGEMELNIKLSETYDQNGKRYFYLYA